MATPIKFLRASIGSVSVKLTATVGGVAGIPYQWNATLTVVAQAHSDPTSTPVANYYTGRNVVVGDWITSDASGKALKVASITSQTDTSVVCVLEDVDFNNAYSDETGNLDGMIPNGAGIGAYIFSVKNSVPILGNIPASLPGNLAGSNFVNNIQSRFASQLPSFVDDVEEYAKKVNFPVAGEVGKIYVALDTNKVFRWSGSTYIEIVATPGSTDAVTEGSTNLYFTDARAQAAVAAGAPTALNSLAKVAAALTAETATREATDLAMQTTIDALSVTDIDGGEF